MPSATAAKQPLTVTSHEGSPSDSATTSHPCDEACAAAAQIRLVLSSQAVPCKPPQGAQDAGTERSPLSCNPSRANSMPWLPVVRSAPSAKTFASAVHVRHQARGPQIWLSFAPWGPDPGWPGPPWQLLGLQDKSVGAKRDRAWEVPQLENISLCTSPSHSVQLSKLQLHRQLCPQDSATDKP